MPRKIRVVLDTAEARSVDLVTRINPRADRGEAVVTVDATGLAPGAATSVANTGTLGGFFTPTGGEGHDAPTLRYSQVDTAVDAPAAEPSPWRLPMWS